MWKRSVKGEALHFRLAGINNQNFLMRDQETGSWWQQITGRCIFGPLKDSQLDPVLSDELVYATWKQESPQGKVLAPVAKDSGEYDSNWEPEVAKMKVVISFPGTPLQSRDVVIGMQVGAASRAYPLPAILAESVVADHLGGEPIVMVTGPDGKSVRAFVAQVNGQEIQLFRKTGTPEWGLVDSTSGGEWNFRGCAVSGPLAGKCLPELPALKDYWFDWRNYHPETTVYKR